MTVSHGVREVCAHSAHEGPARPSGGSPSNRSPFRRWFPLIAIALAASALLPFQFQTRGDGSIWGGAVALQTSPAAQASPLLDDPASPEGANDVQNTAEGDADETGGEAENVDTGVDPQDGISEGGSARVSTSSRGGARPAVTVGQTVVSAAMEQLGARYRWGGSTPAGFDCSGFTMYVYGQVGIDLPRNHPGQISTGRRVDANELRPGDLVFFENTYTWGLSHSGIYVGDNQFIHAETDWTGVVLSPLFGSNWGRHFAGASRPYEQ